MVQRLHRRVSSIRQDAIHKITSHLAKNHSCVVIENLNVAGMLKNHRLAGSIADASFGEFRRQLEYKTQRYGSELVVRDKEDSGEEECSATPKNVLKRDEKDYYLRGFESQAERDGFYQA